MKSIKAILSSPKKVQTESSPRIDTAFEALLDGQDVPSSLRLKLMTVDASVKQAFLSSSTISCVATNKSRPSTKSKHARQRSIGFLLSTPTKKSKVAISDCSTFDEPLDFIQYLDRTSPQLTRCETVHRLNMFLRSQPAAWVSQFVTLDGFQSLAKQVEDIIEIQWREDHEDELLSELLACIQGLCTVRAGMEKLNSGFLRNMTNFLFADKQPADFTCRGRIVSILEIYLTARAEIQHIRAIEVLSYLADPTKPLAERPLEMLEKALKPRPYKRWTQELDKVTKDCFWAFLHSDNKIPILSRSECLAMPRRRPVVPEGYVGGVEWLVMEYICTHLSLVNKILESLPFDERSQVRSHLKSSNFEDICGSRLRRASTKFYIRLHEELRQWVSDANADGWPVAFVSLGVSRDDWSVPSRRPSAEEHATGHRRTKSSFLPELQF